MNDCENVELLWVQLSETADSEFDGGRYTAAAQQWQNAHGIAQNFDERDPRIASSLNNLAIAFRINGNFEEAEEHYRLAIEGWEAAAQWVDEMHLQGRARSTVIHFLREQKYREQYNRLALREYQKIYPAGYAGTLNNLAELFHATNRLKDADIFYHQALQKRINSMGDNESGVATIRNNIASISDMERQYPDPPFIPSREHGNTTAFLSRAAEHRWIVDKPPEFTDTGRLMAAILLTHLLEHSRFCMAHA